jgi:dipeptidyl aminopeptidase/acylaminoacyl peptidase
MTVYQKTDSRHACHAAMRVIKWSHNDELCRDNQSKRARFAGRKMGQNLRGKRESHHRKVTFQNRYGITLVGDLYIPKDRGERKLAAIAVSGPFGAVKEQSSGLYAQTLAEQGFVTLAFDPSYTGESGGYPRNVASPDINTEDFSAAVDFWIAKRGGSQPNWPARHLRLGRYGAERRRDGYPRESGGHQRHVRHEPRDGPRRWRR